MTKDMTEVMTDMRNTTTAAADTAAAGDVHLLHTTAGTDLDQDPALTVQDVTEGMKMKTLKDL